MDHERQPINLSSEMDHVFPYACLFSESMCISARTQLIFHKNHTAEQEGIHNIQGPSALDKFRLLAFQRESQGDPDSAYHPI